jgi:DNA-directed RNA polymerase specialized sigma24 family protein
MNLNETQAAQIFLMHHDFVKGVALKHAPWPGLMEDITQQVFLEFLKKESQWDLEADVRPLLATMTRLVALRLWRERTRTPARATPHCAARAGGGAPFWGLKVY